MGASGWAGDGVLSPARIGNLLALTLTRLWWAQTVWLER
jgi:hypothetical protein